MGAVPGSCAVACQSFRKLLIVTAATREPKIRPSGNSSYLQNALQGTCLPQARDPGFEIVVVYQTSQSARLSHDDVNKPHRNCAYTRSPESRSRMIPRTSPWFAVPSSQPVNVLR